MNDPKVEAERRKVLIAMVGTEGLKDLEAIARLIHSNHYDYEERPYMVACHLLNKAIMEARDANCEQIGLCKSKPVSPSPEPERPE
ncbi:MAG: hypothetical protein KGI38_12605 [Thaumarchaeota archaeon]|nr:hypothetical protein [Nitrososphaerota archaeon]